MEANPTIVCAHCGSVNRVSRSRLDAGETSSRGKCHGALSKDEIVAFAQGRPNPPWPV